MINSTTSHQYRDFPFVQISFKRLIYQKNDCDFRNQHRFLDLGTFLNLILRGFVILKITPNKKNTVLKMAKSNQFVCRAFFFNMYIITCSRNRLHEYPTWKFAECHPLQNIYGDIGDMSCHFRIMVGLSRTMLSKIAPFTKLRLIVRSRDTLLFHFEDKILFFERSFHLNFYCAHHDLSNAPSHDLLRKFYFFLYHYGAYT